jgi:monoamine oxidase
MNKVDTIIIGGGFAGVSAARILNKAGQSILLLEARDRIGGRVYTKRVEKGISLDLGGQWIGPTQNRMYELVEEYGLEIYPTYSAGKSVLELNSKISTYTGVIPKINPISLLYIEMTMKRLNRMAQAVDLDAPWSHPKAAKWDAMTLAAYISKKVKTKKARSIVTTALETVLACAPEEVSLLHVLFYIKSGKNLNNLIPSLIV